MKKPVEANKIAYRLVIRYSSMLLAVNDSCSKRPIKSGQEHEPVRLNGSLRGTT